MSDVGGRVNSGFPLMHHAAALASVILLTVIFQFYGTVDAYMDEIFHVPQAQAYCAGRFDEWNPKITTFPGMYIVAVFAHRCIQLAAPVYCSLHFLRGINVAMAAALPMLYYYCRRKISIDEVDRLDLSAVLFLYPGSFFYYYLCYTDTMSSATLVLTYFLSIDDTAAGSKGRGSSEGIIQQLTALTSATACILARQTNAVWLLFIAGTKMIQLLDVTNKYSDDALTASKLLCFVRCLWTERVLLLRSTWPLLLPVCGFIAFVLHTGSIVLGDAENHKPVVHGAMISHALALSGLIISPMILMEMLDWKQEKKKVNQRNVASSAMNDSSHHNRAIEWCGRLLISVAVGAALVKSSHSHPFLEADNRHYTFYLWKRVLQHDTYRIFLAVPYAAATALLLSGIRKTRGPVWIIILLIAAAITLLPTPLLEPRYFTPTVIFTLLNSPLSSEGTIFMSVVAILFLAIDCALIFVFLYRTFTWPDGSIARFMP